MGLLDTLNDLEGTPDEVTINDGELKDVEKAEEPEKEEVAEEEDHSEEPEKEEEEAPTEPNPDKEKVSGYQRRRTKEFEEQLAKANEEREYFRKQNEQMQQMMQQLMTQQKQAQEPTKEAEPEIDPNIDPEAWLINNIQKSQKGQVELADTIKQIQYQMTLNNAKQELSSMESDYAKANQDYYDVVKNAFDREVAKQKFLNPNATEQSIRQQLELEKVQLAARFAQNGQNPVDAMYNYMVSVYGRPQKDQNKEDKPQKVDTFEVVKKNKAKAATPLSAGGRGSSGNALTKDHANGMTLSDFARLSADDKVKIYAD